MNANKRETRRVAVIDIGASSVRLQVAEIHPDGRVHKLNGLSQAVSLGRDSFTQGAISKSTMDDCVNVLLKYREAIREYGLDVVRDVRVVATSGLREATNRIVFQDRVSIATGFEIESFDSAELHRLTYLGLFPVTREYPELFRGDTVVCEVGGGNTEFLLLEGIDIRSCRMFRLGALRLRASLEGSGLSRGRMRKLLESRINPAVQQIQHMVSHIDAERPETERPLANYVAIGGDVRFAAQQLQGRLPEGDVVAIPTRQLVEFTDRILESDPEQIAARHRMVLTDAQSLGPALLIHTTLATRFNSEWVHVVSVNLRDSLIRDMSGIPGLYQPIDVQIVRAATLLGHKFNVDLAHAGHVALLACTLFEQLEHLHQLPFRYRIVIHLAALLHECGLFVNSRSFHKHGMYLIMNSELFGISEADLKLIALVVRYHRRTTPQPSHEHYSELGREDRIAVSKMAAMLRLAKALDAPRNQKVSLVNVLADRKSLKLVATGVEDHSSAQVELRQEGKAFEELFGIRPELLLSEVGTPHE